MLEDLLFLLVTFVATFALYPLWINFVYRYHMGERIRGDGPESHQKKQGTPTMGGVVFLLTIAVVTLLFNRSRTQTLFPIFVTALAGMLGLLEDFSKVYKTSDLPKLFGARQTTTGLSKLFFIKPFVWVWDHFKSALRIIGSSPGRGFSSHQKMLIQFFLAGFVAYWTYIKLGWDFLWLPLIGNVEIGIFYPFFIFFLFLAVMNFVAFTDGLDGLVAGLAVLAFGFYWVIAGQLAYNSLTGLAATFIGGLIPFLYFNIFPARIFMGDVGSHALGAALAVFAIVMHREVALFLILAVFLVDGFSSPLQQITYKLTKKRLFRMAPLHHHFELLGWNETKVALRFWLFGAVFGFVGVFIALL